MFMISFKYQYTHNTHMEINLSLLAIQNPWWTIDWHGKKRKHSGLNFDPTIYEYLNSDLKWHSKIVDKINFENNNFYFLQGPPGIGKSTIIKNLIKKLIETNKVDQDNIFYYSCHNFYTFEQLNEAIKTFLTWRKGEIGYYYVFIDEIEAIPDWQQGIKHLKNAGKLTNIKLILSGTSLKKEKEPNFFKNIIINPLDFSEVYYLLNPKEENKITTENYLDYQKRLDYYLDIYLLTGGYINTLNSFKKNGAISQNIYDSQLSWLMSDILAIGRDPILLKQILGEFLEKIGQPIGYQTIAKKTKAKTHLTIAKYFEILDSMFVTRSVHQINESGSPATTKAKKVYFSDPFLFWLTFSFISGSLNFWEFSRERLHIKEVHHNLLTNIVLNHLDKIEPGETQNIFYWRNNIKKQEIDFIYKKDKIAWPIITTENTDEEKNEKIFQSAGFDQGIIISHHKLDLSKNFKIMPLTYFLLFYKIILK